MSAAATPEHIAVIMDGNGRWAVARGLPRSAGHQAGVDATRRLVEACVERRIGALTIFAFSSENWRRPAQEVKLLMELFRRSLQREVERLHRNQVRVRFIGDCARFSAGLRKRIAAAQELTAANRGLVLNIAVNYGGRWDVVAAARSIAERVAEGGLSPAQVDEALFAQHLSTATLPEPDLFIRTGGEHRLSNYLLWQLAYTELWFSDLLWPDFDAAALDEALRHFAGKQRRYGRTGEQVQRTGHA